MLKEAEAGVWEEELCRRIGIRDATFHHRKTIYKIQGTRSERGTPCALVGSWEWTAEVDPGAAVLGSTR